MSDDYERDHLSRLRRELSGSFLSLMSRSAFAMPRGGGGHPVTRAGGVAWSTYGASGTPDSGLGPQAPYSTADLRGGDLLLNDERKVRALAKEIKRLITEDKRRGIGV